LLNVKILVVRHYIEKIAAKVVTFSQVKKHPILNSIRSNKNTATKPYGQDNNYQHTYFQNNTQSTHNKHSTS